MKTAETEIKSSSDRHSHSWKSTLLPNGPLAGLYVILALVLLALMNTRVLWNYLYKNISSGDTSSLTSSVPQIRDWSALISGHDRLGVALFWAAIGFFVYLLFWLGYSLIIDVENDFTASHFVRPKELDKNGYWRQAMGAKVTLALVLIIWVLFIMACIEVLPIFSQLFLSSILKGSWYSVIGLSLSICGVTLFLHIANTLRVLLVSAWRQLFI